MKTKNRISRHYGEHIDSPEGRLAMICDHTAIEKQRAVCVVRRKDKAIRYVIRWVRQAVRDGEVITYRSDVGYLIS